MKLKNKVCIVTGGGSGIGYATALAMSREGARVVVVGRTSTKLNAVEQEIKAAGNEALAYTLDVASPRGTQVMVKVVLQRFGRIDVLVNNAGENSRHRRLLTTTPEETRAIFDSSVFGSIYCCQAVIPAMLRAGRGTIVNISSLAGMRPGILAGMAYGAAKAAVINFTEYLNVEYRNTGIRASVILPGEVNTPIMNKRPSPPGKEARAAMMAAEDVAETITFLVSLPARVTIPEVVIRPTILRSTRAEIEAELPTSQDLDQSLQ